MFRKLFAVVMAMALLPTVALAGHPAEDLVKRVTSEIIETLEKPQAKVDKKFVQTALERDVVPHIDFTLMTKLAVGKHWTTATAEQKKSLVAEFQDLLVNTYTRALNEYSGQSLEFLPFKPEEREDRAVVSSIFKDSGGVKFPVDYKLRNKDAWLIYDIEVENISLVLGYRSDFSSQIAKGGLDGLIRTLREKNGA